MKRFSVRRPSPSMLVALLALVVAATGTAVAATSPSSGDQLIKKDSLSGNRLRDHTLTRRQIRISALGRVPRAHHADTADTARNADNATNADHATSADQATNADHASSADSATVAQSALNAAEATDASQLGASPASAYQKACQPGAIAAYVYVKGSASFPSTYTSATPPLQDQFDCTTGTVSVKRTGAGVYDVHFGGLDNGGQLVAVGNQTVDPVGNQVAGGEITYKLISDNTVSATVYQVKLFDPAGTAVDTEFSFALLSPA